MHENIDFENLEENDEVVIDNKLKRVMIKKMFLISFVVMAILIISKYSKQRDFNPAFPADIYNANTLNDIEIILRDNIIFLLFVISVILLFGIGIYILMFSLKPENNSKELNKNIKGIYEILSVVPYFVLVISIINMSLFSISVIEGRSMEPNYFENENTIINHIDKSYDRFDVVIIKVPDEGYWIKRIIGLPGEKVVIDHNVISIDGNVIEQEFLLDSDGSMINYTYCYGVNPDYCEIEVTEGSYFVLGDNRPVSNDSRSTTLGLVNEEQLYGIVVYKYEGIIFNIYN